jgi:hypothetical protein
MKSPTSIENVVDSNESHGAALPKAGSPLWYARNSTTHPVDIQPSGVVAKSGASPISISRLLDSAIADRVFANPSDAASYGDGISFRQSAHGQLENSRIRVQFITCSRGGQSDSPTTSFCANPVFAATQSEKPFIKRHSITQASAVGAIERFPVHRILSSGERLRLTRAYEMV